MKYDSLIAKIKVEIVYQHEYGDRYVSDLLADAHGAIADLQRTLVVVEVADADGER